MKHLVEFSFILCISVLLVQAKLQEKDLAEEFNMAGGSFDDQYIGCKDEMEHRLAVDNILEKEKTQSKTFKRAWNEATSIWEERKKEGKPIPHGINDFHAIALVAATGFIRDEFNFAVKSAGKSQEYYDENFHFKFLHFYLTSALQALSSGCPGTSNLVHKGIEGIRFKASPELLLRFGWFLSTSSDLTQGTISGNDTIFIIQSCYGVETEWISQFPLEKEVLIPGYEVFRISHVWEESNKIFFTSTNKTCAYFNCAYIGGGQNYQNCSDIHDSAGRAFLSGSIHLLFLLTLVVLQVLYVL